MKKLMLILLAILVFTSCKEDKQNDSTEAITVMSQEEKDDIITLRGDFIYDEIQNAAVLYTPNQVYGVVVDDNMKILNEKVSAFKKAATDMIPVTVTAKRMAKIDGEEGWPFQLEIKKIIKVEAPDPNTNDIIKLEN